MATIVPLPAPRSRTASEADHQAGATILFFTGVRYMRDEEVSDEAPTLGSDANAVGDDEETVALSLM